MIEKEIQKLIAAKRAYYINGRSDMTDQEFDALEEYVRQQNPDHPYFEITGHDPSPYWNSAEHNIPMGSLDKVHNENDIKKWAQKYKGSFFTLEWKLDGLSLSLDYENSKFVRAITRGNGFKGEDISDNVVLMQNFKKILPDFEGSLRAEIILYKEDFERINSILSDSDKYSNPRNAAAGISRRLDGKFCKYLRLIYYDITEIIDEHEKIKKLRDDFNLVTVESYTDNDFNKIISTFNTLKDLRSNLPFEIDGAVIKVSSIDIQQKEGSIKNKPKAQKAWKFDPPGAVTVFLKEEWDVGRTGVVTPLAHLKPVQIEGSEIKKATLHNIAEIKRLGIGYGDTVMIEKRGDIIPKIISVIEHKNKPIKIPNNCPYCNSLLSNDGIRLFCTNENCFRKEFYRILYWIKTLEIDGFGKSLTHELCNEGKLTCIADIYRLKKYDISALERWGEKSAEKIMNSIEKSKNITPTKFLTALGIPGISDMTCKELLQTFGTIDELMNKNVSDIIKLKGFSDISASNIVNGLAKFSEEIKYLLKIINLKTEETKGSLSNISFCFTGIMEHPRLFYQDLVKKHGGINKSSVTKDLTYLVCNENKGSTKSRKAEKYGTKIITEKEFLSILPSNPDFPKKIKLENYSLFDNE